MPQTIRQRRILTDRVQHGASNHAKPSLRREQRGNIIEWRRQVVESRQRAPLLPAISAPGEDGSKPFVSRRVQNVVITLVGIAALFIARSAGVL